MELFHPYNISHTTLFEPLDTKIIPHGYHLRNL